MSASAPHLLVVLVAAAAAVDASTASLSRARLPCRCQVAQQLPQLSPADSSTIWGRQRYKWGQTAVQVVQVPGHTAAATAEPCRQQYQWGQAAVQVVQVPGHAAAEHYKQQYR